MRKFTQVCYLYRSITNFHLSSGLRVSQFNGDKSGATSDPTQKTITNFITSGEAIRNSSSFPDVTDHDFVSDTETDLSFEDRQTIQDDCIDPFDVNHSSDVDDQSCTVWKNDGAEEVFLSPTHTPYFA